MTESVLIGEAGLERIRKISSLPAATKTKLYSLIPFLELSVQQDYIVNRIKELSQGGAMSEFKWNGGGRFKGMFFWESYAFIDGIANDGILL